MRTIFVFAAVALLLGACGRNVESTGSCKVIDIENAPKAKCEIKSEGKEIVALETTDNSLIKRVTSLFVTDEYIIVFDSGSHRILQFDRKGKFIRCMSRQGRGPKEIPWFAEVIFHDNLLYVLGMGKLLVINMAGDVVRSIALDNFGFNSCYPTSNGGFWAYLYSNERDRPYYLSLLDENLNVVNNWGEKHPQALYVISPQKYFFNDGAGELYFYHCFTDSIYHLTDNGAEPVYRFDFGESDNLDYQKISQLCDHDEISNERNGKMEVGGGRAFVGDYLIFTYAQNLKDGAPMYYGAYDTKTGKTYRLSNGISIPFFLHKPTKEGAYFYLAIPPHVLDEDLLKEYEQHCGHTIKEDDNPIIVIDKVTVTLQ